MTETEKKPTVVPVNSSVTEDTSGDTDCVGSSSKPCPHLNCGTSKQQQAACAVNLKVVFARTHYWPINGLPVMPPALPNQLNNYQLNINKISDANM